MNEIEIINKQLKKLKEKGYILDIINDTICLIDTKIFLSETKTYNESINKHNNMRKGHELNGDIIDASKFIVAIF